MLSNLNQLVGYSVKEIDITEWRKQGAPVIYLPQRANALYYEIHNRAELTPTVLCRVYREAQQVGKPTLRIDYFDNRLDDTAGLSSEQIFRTSRSYSPRQSKRIVGLVTGYLDEFYSNSKPLA